MIKEIYGSIERFRLQRSLDFEMGGRTHTVAVHPMFMYLIKRLCFETEDRNEINKIILLLKA